MAIKGDTKRRGVAARQPLPRAVAQAVLQDAVMEAAADLAATVAMRDEAALSGSADVLFAKIHPETPEEQELLELLSVPFLGLTRARALADSGIRTVADLQAASPSQIGGVKGVGLRNAERIKNWLATQKNAAPGMPPAPPDIEMVTVCETPEAVLALDNATIFDSLGEIDSLTTLLRSVAGADGPTKKLGRQLEKIATVTSELAEGPDTLSPKQLQQAVKLLTRIVETLQAAADRKRLSDKKQATLAESLREHRKALQTAIGD